MEKGEGQGLSVCHHIVRVWIVGEIWTDLRRMFVADKCSGED